MATLAIVALILAAGPAPSPAAVLVSPDVVEVSAERPWGDLVVQNAGGAPREVRVQVLEWRQDEHGGVELWPAGEDVGIFPARAVLGDRERRTFRLSVLPPAPERERAYRILVAVHDLETGAEATALVPAFFAPELRAVATAVALEVGQGSACRVTVVNLGTVRVRPDRITVALPTSAGDTRERQLEPWWVLAGGSRAYDVPVPPETDCARDVVARVHLSGKELFARAASPREAREAR